MSPWSLWSVGWDQGWSLRWVSTNLQTPSCQLASCCLGWKWWNVMALFHMKKCSQDQLPHMEFLLVMYSNFTITIPDSLSHVIWSSKCNFIHKKYIEKYKIHEQGGGLFTFYFIYKCIYIIKITQYAIFGVINWYGIDIELFCAWQQVRDQFS